MRRALGFFIVGFVVFGYATAAHAACDPADSVFTGPDNGSWDTGANWTPAGVPATRACIPAGKPVTKSSATAVGSLRLEGSLTVAAGTRLPLTSTTVQSTFTGLLRLGTGARFLIGAGHTLDMTSDVEAVDDGGKVENSGTMVLRAASIDALVDNDGTVTVQKNFGATFTDIFGPGDVSGDAGDWQVAEDATLRFREGSRTVDGAVGPTMAGAVPGALSIAGDDYAFNGGFAARFLTVFDAEVAFNAGLGDVVLRELDIRTGTVTGTADIELTGPGLSQWSAGTLGGTGTLTAGPASYILIGTVSPPETRTIARRVISQGHIEISNLNGAALGSLALAATGRIDSSGLLDLDGSITAPDATRGVLVSTGTLQRAGAPGDVRIDARTVIDGTATLSQPGVFELVQPLAGNDHDAAFTLSNSAALRVSGAGHRFAGTVALPPTTQLAVGDGVPVAFSGSLSLAGGTVTGGGDLTVQAGGRLDGTGVAEAGTAAILGTVAPGGDLTLRANTTFGDTGRLEAGIPAAGAADRLVIDGSGTLGGTLALTNPGGRPAAGEGIDVVTCSPCGGTFATVTASEGEVPRLRVSPGAATVGRWRAAVGDAAGPEAGAIGVPVSLPDGPVDQDVTFAVSASAGTATAGTDFLAPAGAVTIPAGARAATITVPVVGDQVDEADETLTVTLSPPSHVAMGKAAAAVTIADDDAAAPATGGPGILNTQGTVADAILSCEKTRLVLIDVVRQGRQARITGLATPSVFAGKEIELLLQGKPVATPTVSPAGTFSIAVPAPKGTRTRWRYQLRSGSERSRRIDLDRRSIIDRVSVKGDRVVIRGHITPPFALKAAPVVFRRQTSCTSFERVGEATPNGRGRFTAKLPVPPPPAKVAIYKGLTLVTARPHGKAKNQSATLARAVTIR